MKSISYTVTNDLSQDQRMIRICSSIQKMGFDAVLMGRRRTSSIPLVERSFLQKRIPCFFDKGKLFYIEYNIRIFFVLLLSKYDAYCAIDLDTLLPNYLVSKLKRKPLIYDAHEYFSELEEVVNRPFTRWVWKTIEQWIVPKVDVACTVSAGYKKLFDDAYHTDFKIVRNATVLRPLVKTAEPEKYILYQGAVNHGRGLEQLMEAMIEIDCKLIICGVGDVLASLKRQVHELKLEQKVKFLGFVEPEDLIVFTRGATIGLTLFANAGLSNQYSLANRFFDYMHSCVPQIAMGYPEYLAFNKEWEVAMLLEEVDSGEISRAINKLLNNQDYYNRLKNNCLEARESNNWQQEEKVLKDIYSNLF